jgi:hypothetical protein
MIPEWFKKPETLFWTLLWLASPFLTLLVGKVLRHVEAWHAARSESTAKASLVYLYNALSNPPTLLQSVAHMVCFLPIPIALTMALLLMYVLPVRLPHLQLDPGLAWEIRATFLSLIFFSNYVLFGFLAVYGIRVAYWLRHGEARYGDNYKAGIQKRIEQLKKKFPQL